MVSLCVLYGVELFYMIQDLKDTPRNLTCMLGCELGKSATVLAVKLGASLNHPKTDL